MDEGAGAGEDRRRDGQHFDCATWLHKARELPKEEFRRAVEKELTGREEEPSELIYFKVYKSQIPVIEQAIETAALMLGTDKSRGYCLEMICADFLAGAHLDNGNPEILLSRSRATTSSCPENSNRLSSKTSAKRHPETMTRFKAPPLRLDPCRTKVCASRSSVETAGGVKRVARCRILRCTHGIPQPFGSRRRGKPDYAVRGVSPTSPRVAATIQFPLARVNVANH